MQVELRHRVRNYLANNGLSLAAMARHAGIPYRTLIGVLDRGKAPRAATAAALEAALRSPPPQRLPRHGSVVASQWGTKSSTEIGKPLGISGARVRAIAKRMGLTAGDTPAQP